MSIAFNVIFAQSALCPLNHNPQWKASVNIREYGPRLAAGDYQKDYEIHLCLRLLKAFLCKEMLSMSTHLLDQIILQDSKATSYEALPTLEEMLNHIGNITSGESLEFHIPHDDLLPEQLHERIENLPIGRGSLYRAWIPFGNFMEDGVTAFEETYGVYKESKNSLFLIDTTANLSIEQYVLPSELAISLILKMSLSAQQPPAKIIHYPIRKTD